MEKEFLQAHQAYLDEQLKEARKMFTEQLSSFKKGLRAEKEFFLVKKIKEAEKEIEKAKKNLVEVFQREMVNIQKNRENGFPESLLERRERFTKTMFEKSLKTVTGTWVNFIKLCKDEL